MPRTLLCILLLTLCNGSFGQQSVTTPWSPEDVVSQDGVSDFAFRRDGQKLLWMRWRADAEEDRPTPTLVLTDVASGEHRDLTVGRQDIRAPAWSPLGTQIAFLSSRKPPPGVDALSETEDGPQIYILPLTGGEPRRVTKIPHGVRAFSWIDESTLILSAREVHTSRERDFQEAKDDSIVVENLSDLTDGAVRLFRLDLKTSELRRATQNTDSIAQFAVSPDGKAAVAMHTRSPSFEADGFLPPRCVVHDLTSGASLEILATNRSKPTDFTWKLDGSGFYARIPRSLVDGEDEASITLLYEVEVPSLRVRSIPLRWTFGLAGTFVVLRDGFLAGLCDGVRPRLARYTETGGDWTREFVQTPANVTVHELVKARDADQLLYVTGTASDPDHHVTGRLDGGTIVDHREILRPNDGFATKPLAKREILQWIGALGEPIEGILYYPHDWKEGEKRPLVLSTHGGPHAADYDRFGESWAYSPNLYAQRGAFVLSVNYHGSSDYGPSFSESIKGRYYELEVIDLFTGIRHLEERGWIDRNRLGAVGWSNGAILSLAMVAMADAFAPGFGYTFRACAPGAGDVNWTSDYGNCAFGSRFDRYYLGGSPWTHRDDYLRKSPLFYAHRVTTPTIIFFGSQDTAVPTEQGWQWYRALKEIDKAPVRFLLFPGEGHGLRKTSHQRRKLEEELAWMDRHLFDRTDVADRLPKSNSPLARVALSNGYARHRSRHGTSVNGMLVPETVPFRGIEVGRFEVTRAQWQEFAPATALADGEADLPMVGVSADDAKAYAAFLAEQTGRPFRLLTAAEAKALPVGPDENTFERWIGETLPPSEAESMIERLLQLGWRRLLRPVGTTAPGLVVGAKPPIAIHDAGGNAAEWVMGANERVTVTGPCVVVPNDERREPAAPPAGYIGLRVAVGPRSEAPSPPR